MCVHLQAVQLCRNGGGCRVAVAATSQSRLPVATHLVSADCLSPHHTDIGGRRSQRPAEAAALIALKCPYVLIYIMDARWWCNAGSFSQITPTSAWSAAIAEMTHLSLSTQIF